MCNWFRNLFRRNLKRFSSDDEILSALKILDDISAEEVFSNLEENSIFIKFRYLPRNCYGCSMIDNMGNRFIAISSCWKNSEPEELACIIAHESFHKLEKATLEEEVLATYKEGQYWKILKKDKEYSPTRLLSRLNSLLDLSETEIESRISRSEFYKHHLV